MFLYEGINIFNTTVGFYFFATQIPYYIWGNQVDVPGMDQSVKTTGWWLVTIIGHAIPSLVLSFDGLVSSVQFYVRHCVVMMGIAAISILIYLIVYFLHPDRTQSDNSWFASPWVITTISLSILVYLPSAWMVMVWLTRKKIRRRFKCMQDAE